MTKRTYKIRGYKNGCTGHDVVAPTRLYAVYSTAPDTDKERMRATALTGREAQASARTEAIGGWTPRIVRLTGADLREAQDLWAETTGTEVASDICAMTV